MSGGDGTRIVERWTVAGDGLTMDRIMTHQLPLSEFHAGMAMVAAGTESVKVTLSP